MVHNGIEYGLMAAYAEGLNILKHADVGASDGARSTPRPTPLRTPSTTSTSIDLADVDRGVAARQRHRLVAPRPHRPGARASRPTWTSSPAASPTRARAAGRAIAAIDEGVPAPVLTTALYERFASRGEADFANKVLSAMRFGVRRARREAATQG